MGLDSSTRPTPSVPPAARLAARGAERETFRLWWGGNFPPPPYGHGGSVDAHQGDELRLGLRQLGDREHAVAVGAHDPDTVGQPGREEGDLARGADIHLA